MTRQGKIFLLIFFLSAAFIVFRAHYYSGFPLVVAFLFVLGTAIAALDEFFWNGKKQGFWGRLILSVSGVGLLVTLLWLNDCYCDKMLVGKSEIIDGRIERSVIRRSRGHSTEVFVYEYTFRNTLYSNEINAEGSGVQVGDEVKLKVSCLDPTVSQLQN